MRRFCASEPTSYVSFSIESYLGEDNSLLMSGGLARWPVMDCREWLMKDGSPSCAACNRNQPLARIVSGYCVVSPTMAERRFLKCDQYVLQYC